MKKIIFDEKSQIEDILKKKELDKISIKWFLVLLVKYLYEDFKYLSVVQNKKEILKYISENMNMPVEYEEYKYDSFIEHICRNIRSGQMDCELKQIKKIDITYSEMEIVKMGENDKEKKFLFTLYVLAKSVLHPTGWVGYTDSQILEYGNLKSCTNNQMHIMIHNLYKRELMDFNHRIDAGGYYVGLGEDTYDVVLSVTQFNNFGNQCLSFLKKDWKMCENCGKMIKIKGPNTKYCKKCSVESLKKSKQRWEKRNKKV